MKTLILLAALLAVSGCHKRGEGPPQPIGEFKVEKLFTHEGCTVYRFRDSRTVYYTDCAGSTSSAYSCGKNCTAYSDVTTEKRPL